MVISVLFSSSQFDCVQGSFINKSDKVLFQELLLFQFIDQLCGGFQAEIQDIKRPGVKYEFDIPRMSSIVENIFWREGEIKSPRGRSSGSRRYKVSERELNPIQEIRRSHIQCVFVCMYIQCLEHCLTKSELHICLSNCGRGRRREEKGGEGKEKCV